LQLCTEILLIDTKYQFLISVEIEY
jgi:hypothetical protein